VSVATRLKLLRGEKLRKEDLFVVLSCMISVHEVSSNADIIIMVPRYYHLVITVIIDNVL